MPRISIGTLSRPCEDACAPMLWLIVSLMRARLMMHSRITDSATCRKSASSSEDSAAAAPRSESCGIVRRRSCWSSRSSTRNKVDAMSRMV